MTAPVTMLALAAHFAGDFLLQPDEMSVQKFDDPAVRLEHCLTYTAVYLPVVVATGWSLANAVGFLGLIFGSHFVVDSQRWVEPKDGFEAYPVWYDQALHVVSLGLAFALIDGVVA